MLLYDVCEHLLKLYRTIMIDPPWPVNFKSAFGQSKKVQYSTMTVDEIRALPVGALASEDCNLFLWTTHTFLPHSFDLLKAWGFMNNATITWDKGSGLVHCGIHRRTEFVVHGFKSQQDIKHDGQALPSIIRELPELFDEPASLHSRKPISFIRAIEAKTEAPRLEMFARARRAGWDSWGNEVESDIQIERANVV